MSIIVCGQNKNLSVEQVLWRAKADNITANLLKEIAKINEIDRAVAFAQLSDVWWKYNQIQANNWIEKSVDTIYFLPSDKAKSDSTKYLQAVKSILKIISKRNQKQSERLVKILGQTENFTDEEKNTNAEALIDFALKVVKDNPNKAAEIGVLALKIGRPRDFYKLSWELRHYNPAIANSFFKNSFSIVTSDADNGMLQSLQLAAFPEDFVPGFPSNLTLPNEYKAALLSFLADYLAQKQAGFLNKSISSCTTEAFLVLKLEKRFAEFDSQKAALVQQAKNICLANVNQNLTQIQTLTEPLKKASVDELLKQADGIKEPHVRAVYLIKAALAANQQKNYELAIKILEAMTEKERENFLETWDDTRHDSAALLAFDKFQAGDLIGVNQVLKEVSDNLRSFAQIGFVMQFKNEDLATELFLIEKLNDARSGINRSELDFARKINYWLNLVKFYSKYKMHSQSADVYKEFALAFNSALPKDNETAKSDVTNRFVAASERVLPNISPKLFETHENAMLETTNIFKSEKVRLNLNFIFLKVMLIQSQALNTSLNSNGRVN